MAAESWSRLRESYTPHWTTTRPDDASVVKELQDHAKQPYRLRPLRRLINPTDDRTPPCLTTRSLRLGRTPRPVHFEARPSSPSMTCPGPSRYPISSTAPGPGPRTWRARRPGGVRPGRAATTTPRSTAQQPSSRRHRFYADDILSLEIRGPSQLVGNRAPSCSWSCPARSSTLPSGGQRRLLLLGWGCCRPATSSSSNRSRICGKPGKSGGTYDASTTVWT